MKRDYLNGTPYEIEQPEEMYHFNSDTELLGRFMRLKHTDHVLDIGCGTGALLCYAAVQQPASLYGVDLFEEVTAKATENLSYNHLHAHLTAGGIQKYRPDMQFDVILSNPPYFHTAEERLKNQNPYRAAARHESYLPLTDLFASVDRLLKSQGVFYLVHRAERLPELLREAQKYSLYPSRMRVIFKNKDSAGSGVLLCFSRQNDAKMRMDPPVFLDERNTFADVKGEGR